MQHPGSGCFLLASWMAGGEWSCLVPMPAQPPQARARRVLGSGSGAAQSSAPLAGEPGSFWGSLGVLSTEPPCECKGLFPGAGAPRESAEAGAGGPPPHWGLEQAGLDREHQKSCFRGAQPSPKMPFSTWISPKRSSECHGSGDSGPGGACDFKLRVTAHPQIPRPPCKTQRLCPNRASLTSQPLLSAPRHHPVSPVSAPQQPAVGVWQCLRRGATGHDSGCDASGAGGNAPCSSL